MGEENKPRIQAAGDNNNQTNCNAGRNGWWNRQWWSQGNQPGGKFKGKTKDIEFDTFDNTGQHDAAQFNKSLKNIADYLQLNYWNDVSEAVRNMTTVNIPIPATPLGELDPSDTTGSMRLKVSDVDLCLWKREHAKAQDRKDKYDKNMAKAYIIVYHQCSPVLKNDLEAAEANGLFDHSIAGL